MILYGKPVADNVYDDLSKKIEKEPSKPGLAVILIGNDPASEIYVNMKVKKARNLGMYSKAYRLPSDTTQSQILELISDLNQDTSIHGILVQLPIPAHFNAQEILLAISPDKDVDGLSPINMGRLLAGYSGGFIPCTPAGILEIFSLYSIPLEGRHVVVLGRSNIVGKPIAALLMQRNYNASVTILHSKSRNIKEILLSADIIISAIGSPFFLKDHMVPPNCVVIDVGITKIASNEEEKGYRLVGDVDFNNVVTKCSSITPMPGGVGPTTVAMLMRNTWESYQRFKILES